MKVLIQAFLITSLLTSCVPKIHSKSVLSKEEIEDRLHEPICDESYKPVNFELPKTDIDLGQKRLELVRLYEHRLISEQEFQEKMQVLDINFRG